MAVALQAAQLVLFFCVSLFVVSIKKVRSLSEVCKQSDQYFSSGEMENQP